VFVETASGARADRPILEQVLDQLRPGDTLVVWKLDRLGRSLRHLVDTVTGLAERGVGFRSLQEAIDTTLGVSRASSTGISPTPTADHLASPDASEFDVCCRCVSTTAGGCRCWPSGGSARAVLRNDPGMVAS
jgi:hypothetical protein